MRVRRKELRILRDQSQHTFDLLEELIAQARLPLIIPSADVINFALHRDMKTQDHLLRRWAK